MPSLHTCWLQQCQLTCSKLRILPLGEKSFLRSRTVSWSPISHGALMNFQCIFTLSCCFLLYSSASKNKVRALSKEGPKPTDHSEAVHDGDLICKTLQLCHDCRHSSLLGTRCSLFLSWLSQRQGQTPRDSQPLENGPKLRIPPTCSHQGFPRAVPRLRWTLSLLRFRQRVRRVGIRIPKPPFPSAV